jgi:S-adenosylmethionine:tRNA ribosyltransferase-isomerase
LPRPLAPRAASREKRAVGPEAYDYELPEELVAQHPVANREDARLLALRGDDLLHLTVGALPEQLPDGALVVVNDSRVVPARLRMQRAADRRSFELLVCDPAPHRRGFSAWVRGARALRSGDRLVLGEFVARVGDRSERDPRAFDFELEHGELLALLEAHGEVPLPPYIVRTEGPSAADRERYQTVFAREPGSVAAPTAGLHLTSALLARLDTVHVTLHVGPGTFLPMDVSDVRDHRVGCERVEIGEAAATSLERARAQGRPVVAVGTTTTRALEGVAAQHGGVVVPGATSTDLVITEAHSFSVIDHLLTNFHLPRSSLLMLVAAFAGRERVLAAYAEAVRRRYRFYSYGDCMLVTRRPA